MLDYRWIHLCLLAVWMAAGRLAMADTQAPSAVRLEGAVVQQIATGFQFTEGPCWRAAGDLVFSDITGNTVYRWLLGQGAEEFLRPSGNANGITEDRQGRLILAQHLERRVIRLAADGSFTILASHYQGKRLNSPNDLIVSANGTIYFTDPPLGIKSGQELNYSGIYRVPADGNQPELLDKSLELPNGIAFSPDERILYVSDTRKRQIIAFEMAGNGVLLNRRNVVTYSGSGEFDGLKTDSMDNLWVAYSEGFVLVFSPGGQEIGRIRIPERTRNLAWGDREQTKLFVTAGTSVYLVRL